MHWMLLNVAAAVLVARALQPLPQAVFAHHCAVLKDEELTVRIFPIREVCVS